MAKLRPIQCPHSSRLGTPMVTLAGNRLRLNAAFASVAKLDEHGFVGVYSTETDHIALKFFEHHSDAMPDYDEDDFGPQQPLPANVVPIQRDGGNKDVKSRVVTCGQIIDYSPVLSAAKRAINDKCRQFLPLYDNESESWVLQPAMRDEDDCPF